MNVTVEDLKYAKNVSLPIVDAVYARYSGNANAQVPGITHLADIHADRSDLDRIAAQEDAHTQKMLQAAFGTSTLFGSIDREDSSGTGFVAFRGTETLIDWVEDFRFAAVPFKEVDGSPLVHVGFHRVYQCVRRSLTDQLAALNFRAGVNRVIVTGHSLGAAVASLCALDLASHAVLPYVEATTFASPRAYFLKTNAFEKAVPKSLRVANPLDIVTQVPPIIFAYVHVPGGLDIPPKLDDFHDLDKTYAPGLQHVIDESTHSELPMQQAEVGSTT